MPRQRNISTRAPQRPSLSLFLYDLTAASQALPPAAVLPEQFYGPPVHGDTGQGPAALMWAVLEDAIGCFQKQFLKDGAQTQRLGREAEEWIFTDDYRWPFSFVNVCAVLGLDADYIRRGLKQWQQYPAARTLKRRRRGVPAPRPLSAAA